jgi:hypothetical protein
MARKPEPETTRDGSKAPTTVRGETFDGLVGGPGGRVHDLVFERCGFVNPWLYTKDGVFADAERLAFADCQLRARGLSKLRCREITVRNVRRSPLILLTNCLFDRVTIEGDVGRWFFCWVDSSLSPEDVAIAHAFYRDVRFALDIRRARFTGLTMRGIPGHLVLRDPATSVVVCRSKVESRGAWRSAVGKLWADEIDLFLRSAPKLESVVYAAATASPKLPERLAELERLRRAGITE